MVEQSQTKNKKLINKILNNFSPVNLEEEKTDLLEIITNLRDTKNIPALVFERNTYSLMRLAKNLIEDINLKENEAYPDRLKQIEKMEKEAKKRHREMEKQGLLSKRDCGLSDGKSNQDKNEISKIDKMKDKLGLEEIVVEHFQRPTPEFNWCPDKYISEADIMNIDDNLKKYFPHQGDYLHPIIHALWRGIGIYAEGLPDDYLVTVQVMANERKLGVVLSDKSMTFGVSMPFRNVVIYRDPTTIDDLDPLLFKQMEGRAGRRGQDTKGSVIFAGYSWDRIQDLAVSEIPKISGQENVENPYLPIGETLNRVSNKDNKNHIDFSKILTDNLNRFQNPIDDKEYTNWDEYYDIWKVWAPKAMDGDIDLLRMIWRLRKYGYDGICYYHLVEALDKHFSGGDISINRQVEAAHIISFFAQNKKAFRKCNILEKPDDYSKWKDIRDKLISFGINLVDEDSIDNRLWLSIKRNNLYEGVDDKEYQEIREDFYRLACSIRILQNYCYYTKRVVLTKIIGKLFTRCKWILWSSSPLNNFGKQQTYLNIDDSDIINYEDIEEEQYYDSDEYSVEDDSDNSDDSD